MIAQPDISPSFTFNEQDAALVRRILRHEATPRAIQEFAKKCRRMTDYCYWFTLGTLWVSYTGFSDINLWRKLLGSSRPLRDESLMKPTEHALLYNLPDPLRVYRAKRENEKDWIAYTLSVDVVVRFAVERKVKLITAYDVPKKDVLALFARRGEAEIIVLDKTKAVFVRTVQLVSAS